MIIKRTGKIKPLYYISSRLDLNRQHLLPSIPRTELTKHDMEDNKIHRISLFPTVCQAIAARDHVEEGEVLAVYEAKDLRVDDILVPSITQSPKSIVTDERWVVSPVSLDKVGEIEVGKPKKEVTVPMGPRGLKKKVALREWKDLRPGWEQKKRPILEQREFGIRSWISKQFRNSAAKDLRVARKGMNYKRKFHPDRATHELEVKKNLLKRAEEVNDSYVVSSPLVKSSGNYDISKFKGDPDLHTVLYKVSDRQNINPRVNRFNNFVKHTPVDGNPGLAHEIGHSISRSTTKGLKRERGKCGRLEMK